MGAANPPHVVVDLDGAGTAVFQNGNWSQIAPELAIYDDRFVAENVFSGVEVSSSHRQNLHELIVGAQGIALNAALQKHVERIEQHNRDLRDLGDAIPADRRGRLNAENFALLKPVEDVEKKIEQAEKRLAAARASERVATRSDFSEVKLPEIDLAEFEEQLATGLGELDAAALERVQAHIAALGQGGERWIGEGVAFVAKLADAGVNDCPFCAQDLAGSPLLAHYRNYFSDEYEDLKRRLGAIASAFDAEHAGETPAAFERSVRQAVELRAFWKDFAEVPNVDVKSEEIAIAWRRAREAIQQLVREKVASPLERVAVSDEVRELVASHNRNCETIRLLSTELVAANPLLEVVKEQAKDANVATLEADLLQLRAVEARFDAKIAPLCDAYLAERAQKSKTEQARDNARTALDKHRQTAFPAYGVAINSYLQRFNASFRLGPVDAVNNRGGSSANYSLVIDGNPVPLVAGDGQHSFSNTLSAGDRNTLALAFFFASLDSDPNKAQKLVVIDDPMTSLDEHRTLHTWQELERLARETAGIVVLSHSKPFLLGVWNQCQQLQKSAITIVRDGSGSTLAAWDVNDASVTEHDRRYLAAVGYLQRANPAIERRVAESLRPMLESFCRVAYPADFPPGTMLGQFHTRCVQRVGSATEIMAEADARQLRALLDYANRFHHDTNPAFATELINDAELSDFTSRVLRFIRR